jgi:enoyl-CoA hydratase/carnithine racemase
MHAFTGRMCEELIAAFDPADADDDIKPATPRLLDSSERLAG